MALNQSKTSLFRGIYIISHNRAGHISGGQSPAIVRAAVGDVRLLFGEKDTCGVAADSIETFHDFSIHVQHLEILVISSPATVL